MTTQKKSMWKALEFNTIHCGKNQPNIFTCTICTRIKKNIQIRTCHCNLYLVSHFLQTFAQIYTFGTTKFQSSLFFTRILNNSLEMENARLWQARLAAADPVQPRGMRTRSELGPGTGVRTHADSQRPLRARARRTPGRASPVQPTRRTSSGRRERALELSRANSRGGELRSRGLCGFKSGRGQSETLCPGRLGAAPGRGQASCTRGAAGRAAGTDAATRTRRGAQLRLMDRFERKRTCRRRV